MVTLTRYCVHMMQRNLLFFEWYNAEKLSTTCYCIAHLLRPYGNAFFSIEAVDAVICPIFYSIFAHIKKLKDVFCLLIQCSLINKTLTSPKVNEILLFQLLLERPNFSIYCTYFYFAASPHWVTVQIHHEKKKMQRRIRNPILLQATVIQHSSKS